MVTINIANHHQIPAATMGITIITIPILVKIINHKTKAVMVRITMVVVAIQGVMVVTIMVETMDMGIVEAVVEDTIATLVVAMEEVNVFSFFLLVKNH